jgi:hypothetical protein
MLERKDLVKITLVTGREIEFAYEWIKMAPKLQLMGVKLFKPEPGLFICAGDPNWSTIELVEENYFLEKDEHIDIKPKETEQRILEPETIEEPEPEEKKESINEKKERLLAEMIEMSSCQHTDYDMYYSTMSRTDKRTGKTSTIKRYFPVCANCGVREKFVKSADVPEEVKQAAKLWDK